MWLAMFRVELAGVKHKSFEEAKAEILVSADEILTELEKHQRERECRGHTKLKNYYLPKSKIEVWVKVEIHYYGNVIILQYNNCELYRLNGERHLTSAEMIQMENWFFKTISGMNPLAVRDPERLRYELLEKIVRKAYWKNVSNRL